MKTNELIHICVKSDDEVMHRDEEDYRCGISKMALAAFRTGTQIYAYAFMSTHVHIVVLSAEYSRFILIYRSAYTRWFNHKYHREGRLGERYFHIEHLGTFDRTLRAVNYVLRNPVHHLVSDTAIGYEFCSARFVFAEDFNTKEISSDRRTSTYFSSKITLPQTLRLNENGMISPESFLETRAVENLYATAKNFMYQINKPSFRDLEKPEDKDANPLTMDMIEPSYNIEELQQNERKRSVKEYVKDIEVCRIIDRECLSGKTYTQISDSDRNRIANILLCRFRGGANMKQIKRCLAML